VNEPHTASPQIPGWTPMPGLAWPKRSTLALGAMTSAVPCARLHARQMLWEWGYGEISAIAELVTSELVTNAVQSAQRRSEDSFPAQVVFLVSASVQRVRIEVWDSDPRLPQIRTGVTALDESGRGLQLVDALSSGRWGSERCPDGSKVVWAEITLEQGDEAP
jgi:serine/threonine-protein kinase RsbW